MSNEIKHKGSCHCGAVVFEVDAPEHLQVTECNCSICSKSGYLHLILPKPVALNHFIFQDQIQRVLALM